MLGWLTNAERSEGTQTLPQAARRKIQEDTHLRGECATSGALDLALGEIAPLDCQVYDAWGAFLGCRFHADKLWLRASYYIDYTSFLHSRKGTQAPPRRQIGGPARGVAQPGWECL